ncbi:MAG: DegT/DnrJ/EryC1/StrS family aminotransferase [Chloroflexota bacterium]|nr:DegT/DnrJ/EryC1/StrS family aminotransferase [Chloroflexota bacterium]
MANLAVRGGDPLRTKPWPDWPQHDERELRNVQRVLESGNWGGFPSPNVMAGEFAARFAAHHGATYGICTTGGTTAIEVALKAAGLERGDEVLVPALTFYATAFAALVQGFKPVFVDIDPNSWCIDPAQIERHITPDTRAILPVHLGSRMADMDRIGEIAAAHQLRVIEDCAHMHGGFWRERGAGTLGDLGCFSFQSSKLMTSGEGGIILTSDETMAERCNAYVNSGRGHGSDRQAAEGTMLGWNYRITEFQAAVLLAQLERLPEQIALRNENIAHFEKRVAELDGVSTLRHDGRMTTRSGYGVILRYDEAAWRGMPRDRFARALYAEGMRLHAAFYTPVYQTPLFAWKDAPIEVDYTDVHCPVAEKAAHREMIWIPHEVFLGTTADIDDLCDGIVKIRSNIEELSSESDGSGREVD